MRSLILIAFCLTTFVTSSLANVAPNSPAGPTPNNGASNRPINQQFSWTCSDPDGDALTYDVSFGPAFAMVVVATGLTSPAYNPGTLSFLGSYWWQITAHDTQGNQTLGPIWKFTTKANSAPGQPQPFNGVYVGYVSSKPQLSWTCSDVDLQPLTYDLYWGTTNPPPLLVSGLTTTNYMAPDFVINSQYYWRVVASDGIATTSGTVWTYQTLLKADVNQDGQITLEDAACALRIGFVNSCPGDLGAQQFAADFSACSGGTAREAACIHRYVLDQLCNCPDPPAWNRPPVIKETGKWISANELNIILSISDVPQLEAFKFRIEIHGWGPLLDAVPLGIAQGFTDFAFNSNLSYGIVAGYTLDPVDATAEQPFLHLKFGVTNYPYQIILTAFEDDVYSPFSLVIGELPVAVPAAPTETALGRNHPNPFNPTTTIPYTVASGSSAQVVRIAVYDTQGRLVRVLVDQRQTSGAREAVWNGDDSGGRTVASGVYYCVLEVGEVCRTQKLVLLK